MTSKETSRFRSPFNRPLNRWPGGHHRCEKFVGTSQWDLDRGCYVISHRDMLQKHRSTTTTTTTTTTTPPNKNTNTILTHLRFFSLHKTICFPDLIIGSFFHWISNGIPILTSRLRPDLWLVGYGLDVWSWGGCCFLVSQKPGVHHKHLVTWENQP